MKRLIEKIKEDKKIAKLLFISFSVLIFAVGIILTVYWDSLRVDPGISHPNNSNVSSVGFVTEADDRVIISLMPSTFRYSEDAVLPEQGIISTDQDGKDVRIITREYGTSLAYSNGWLYFSNIFDSFKIYKVRLDGSEKQLIFNEAADSLIANGEWLYFHNSNKQTIERINLEDNSKIDVIAKDVYGTDINISGDRLYYLNGDAKRYIFSVAKDGSDNKKMADIGDGYNLVVHGGYMYYIAESTVKRIKINSNKTENFIENSEVSKFVIDDENIFFLSGANKCVFKYDEKSKTSQITPLSDCSEIGIAFGRAYGIGYDFIFEATDEGYNSYGRYSSLNK